MAKYPTWDCMAILNPCLSSNFPWPSLRFEQYVVDRLILMQLVEPQLDILHTFLEVLVFHLLFLHLDIFS